MQTPEMNFPHLDSGSERAVAVGDEVRSAIEDGRGVVALETAVLTHGLPRREWVDPPFGPWLASSKGLGVERGWAGDLPMNLATVRAMADAVRARGAVPAVVGMIEGVLHVGLDEDHLHRLATIDDPVKLSARDLGLAAARRADGGTTVAGTLAACGCLAGRDGVGAPKVMATGGIGGAHRGWAASADVSADLGLLGRTPVCLVSSGAKSILDLHATAEMLDTLAVPVVGHGTDHWPRFISPPDLTLPCSHRLDDVAAIAAAASLHWGPMRQRSAMLVLNPAPERFALPEAFEFDRLVDSEIAASSAAGRRGAEVTPDLLERLVERTGGRSLLANVALLLSNAALAADIALAISNRTPTAVAT
ncbi:MAG: pseudouridine-5'-phosphate glycosidase [Phycisphaerales bacterium]